MIVVIQQIDTANDCCNTKFTQLMIVVIQQIYTVNDCCNTTNLHS